ncbi:MAG TPA: (2Fe-2S) ferredoxin domain-containing protein, partial [Leptospiraceae bacterium]|nr:(2Fe-2S) ferredoxin domain-containing protein [Leptospiraceae bacterium]
KNSTQLRNFMKDKVKEMCSGRSIRVNMAGCLDRCEEGPSVVVYPDGKWFKIETEEQVVEFIRETLIEGKTSTHLSMKE